MVSIARGGDCVRRESAVGTGGSDGGSRLATIDPSPPRHVFIAMRTQVSAHFRYVISRTQDILVPRTAIPSPSNVTSCDVIPLPLPL